MNCSCHAEMKKLEKNFSKDTFGMPASIHANGIFGQSKKLGGETFCQMYNQIITQPLTKPLTKSSTIMA
jgi:hypothetical protein